MITVYAIHDENSNEIYVGMTNDIKRRFSEHDRGQSSYTKKFKKPSLIYEEEFDNYEKGRVREIYLKSGCGKEFLKSLLKK